MKDPYIFEVFLGNIPKQPQRQDSLKEQLATLIPVADKLGCYDAADFIKMTVRRNITVTETE